MIESISKETSGRSITGPRVHLHLNGAALLIGSVFAYARGGHPWWLFALLILAPDLSMIGYLAGNRVGSIVYNAGHSLLIPLVLIAIAVLAETPSGIVTAIGLTWAAHIGMDRAVGFGYKYASGFKDTEIARA